MIPDAMPFPHDEWDHLEHDAAELQRRYPELSRRDALALVLAKIQTETLMDIYARLQEMEFRDDDSGDNWKRGR